jgi:hypothetical protein
MLIEKLSEGVLCIHTPLGPRYLRPSFWQRLYLIWIFRHFDSLPQQVLKMREQRFVETLCRSDLYVSLMRSNGLDDAPVIGTLENRIPIALEDWERRVTAVRQAPGTPVTNEQGTS